MGLEAKAYVVEGICEHVLLSEAEYLERLAPEGHARL